MVDIKLKAIFREKNGRKAKELLKHNQIPAILYGHKIKSESFIIDYLDFHKVFKEAGESTILTLKTDGKDRNVLIKDVQLDPITGKYIHVDFYQVKMTEKITAMVELKFIGESQAVKEEGGILVKNLDEVEVESLPGDLPKNIEVNISSLKKIDDVIRIKDLGVSPKIKLLHDKKEIVAVVTPPRTEEELKELESEVEEKVEEVAGVKKEETEGEATEQEAAAKPEKKEEKKNK